MKPRKAILTAAAVTALFSAGGCVYNEVPCVYGPMPDTTTTTRFVAQYESAETGEFDPSVNMEATVYGPPNAEDISDFDASENENADVYGPPLIDGREEPVELDETSETSDTSETAETAETEAPALTEEAADIDVFKPSQNMEQNVYGPPEWFE